MPPELPTGELIELAPEPSDVRDTEDGGAIVTLDASEETDTGFLDNLAETLPETELSAIASQFLDLIAKDKEARKKRDDQYEDGLRRTGLGDDAPGGASFEGASRVVHPMLTEGCVDFQARVMKELFPIGGPVKSAIAGEATRAKLAKAQRKTDLLNYQLTIQCPEFRAELEQLMTQLPLGGAQYLKCAWNEERNRPTFLFIGIDEMYLPYAASNFYTAQRRTHVQYLTEVDYRERVRSGMYRDVDLVAPGMVPEVSDVTVANDKIEGRQASSYNEDGLRTVFEIHTICVIAGDDRAGGSIAPYIITVDDSSRKVLAIYRNWAEDDETREEQQWFVEFSFVPWRGAYPIGLTHMIGGLSAAATGAIRALLDSAHIQNTPTGLKLKSKIGGQSLNPTPGQIDEIEAGINVTDIRQLFMPMPFNPPSTVLFSLLGFLVDAGRNVVRMTFDDIADMGANTPVGTTMARIEQGLQVYSTIFGRQHSAMGRLLRILHRLNGQYLDDQRLAREAGEELASQKDFQGPLDVAPVADPNIFSEVQRVAQTQTLTQRADLKPQIYNQRAVEMHVLETMKIPDPERFLLPAPEPKEQNAVNENVAATMGRPVTAFPEQDHLAHLATHIEYLMSPVFGMSQLIAPSFIPAILGHIKEHIAWWYAASVFEVSNVAIGADVGDAMKDVKADPEARKAIDRALQKAGAVVVQEGDAILAKLPGVIQQAMQIMQQFAPQPMQDPRVALEGQKLQQQAQADAQDAQIEQQRIQMDAQDSEQDRQVKVAVETLRQDREDARKSADIKARVLMNTDDNRTAMQLAAAEIASGERVAVSTGTGINPNP